MRGSNGAYLEQCAAAWERGDGPAREEAARALGFALDDATAAKVDALLAMVNGQRRKFVLTRRDLLFVMREALDSPHGVAVRHGGADLASKTTMALAVKPPKKTRIVLGLACCWGRPSPGRVWSELKPWYADVARNFEKLAVWLDAKKAIDRVAIALSDQPLQPAIAAIAANAASKAAAGADLLARVLAQPRDENARLVYADWLIERGDPRGELIMVQVALLHAQGAEKTKLQEREKQLLKKHRASITRHAAQVALEMELRAGFVYRIRTTGQLFAAKGASLFEHEPLEELEVSKPSPAGLQALAAAPHVARLRKVELGSPLFVQADKGVDALRAFLESAGARALAELHLVLDQDPYIKHIPVQRLARAFQGIELPALEVLHIEMPGTFLAAWQGVATMRLPALKQLKTSTRAAAVVACLQAAFPRQTAC